MPRNPSLADLAVLRFLSRVTQAIEPDILHRHGATGGAYARLVTSPRTPLAQVYTPHGGLSQRRASRSRLSRPGATHGEPDGAFPFESDFVGRCAEDLIGPVPAKRIVPNGLAPDDFATAATRRVVFDLHYIGELRRLKGVDTMIAALGRLAAKGRTSSLLVVGSGPDRRAFEAQAAAQGLGEAITFSDARPIREVLGTARVMVVPSRSESHPYVVLEAAAARQPLIATNVGGIPEIFGQQAGRLLPPDDPAALPQAIARTLDLEPEKRAREAEALARYVRHRFSLEAMADGVLAGYRTALARRKQGGGDPVPIPASSS